ncbi:hypothetical protein SKA58_16938 [Sphingomonas sp. SKA58]|nr:hypothetical protein SKA58_16938 [Sphingomonas sp. SKA58]
MSISVQEGPDAAQREKRLVTSIDQPDLLLPLTTNAWRNDSSDATAGISHRAGESRSDPGFAHAHFVGNQHTALALLDPRGNGA